MIQNTTIVLAHEIFQDWLKRAGPASSSSTETMAISLASLNRASALKPPRILIHGVAGVGGWIATTWNNMSDPGAFAAAGAEEQEGGEPPPLAGAGVVVCLMG